MGKSKDSEPFATWELDTKMIFFYLCLTEIELGNHPTTHFNKEGWMNLIKHFNEKTGNDYDKTQLKNKWGQLKKDWKIWKELKRGSTGLGWDPKRKTIDASDQWWKEKLEVNPNAKKFRYCGINPELEDKLDLMFTDVVATGVNFWTPNQASQEIDRQEDSKHLHNDIDFVEESPQDKDELIECTNAKSQRSTSSVVGRKKRKGFAYLRDQITQLVNECSASTTTQIVMGPPSMSEVVKVLNQTIEIFENIPLYLYSVKLLKDLIEREAFMSIVPERRVLYLLSYFEKSDT